MDEKGTNPCGLDSKRMTPQAKPGISSPVIPHILQVRFYILMEEKL